MLIVHTERQQACAVTLKFRSEKPGMRDGTSPAPLQTALNRRRHHRLAPKLPPPCICWEKSHLAFQAFLHMACALLLIREGLG
jgi:hypothetical protein